MHFIFWPALTALISCLIAGQQAVGVPAQRKGNPSDHRRGERQEAGRQTEQQLNWPKSSLIPGFQINCYLQNNQIGLVFYYIGNVLFNALCPKSTSKRLRRLKNDSLNGAFEWKWSNQKKSAVRFKSNFIWHILKNLQSASYAKTTVYTTVTKITNKYALKTIR